MTTHDRDKIIAAANECYHRYSEWYIDIERFWQIAFEAGRQAEREDCAAICDAFASGWEKSPGINPRSGFVASSNCAAAIRARSTK